MNRKQFFGNLGALVAIASSTKELASIKPQQPKPIDKPYSPNVRVGDIVISKELEPYYCVGNHLMHIRNSSKPIILLKDIKKGDFVRISNPARENTTKNTENYHLNSYPIPV